MKKWIIVVVCSLFVNSVLAQMVVPKPKGYVDLGLPSGTYWKSLNEDGFYTINNAKKKFGDQIPTKDQMLELQAYCKWEWNGNGYIVTGKNENTIFLPALGYCNCSGSIEGSGVSGQYMQFESNWSAKYSTGISFTSKGVGGWFSSSCNAISVRLVSK